MDAESADMLAALRRQIQPHLMMAALTPPHLSGGHPPPTAASLNYSLPLSTYMMHVSTPQTYSVDLVSRLTRDADHRQISTTNTSEAVNFAQHAKAEARDHSRSRRPSDDDDEADDDNGDEENISDLPLNLVATSLSEEAH